MSTIAIQKVSPAGLETFGGNAMELSVDDAVRQINKVQEIMARVMHKDEHFGTVPGTNKPMLYKPGAEKLGFVFRLTPDYEREFVDLGGGHREYIIKCTLTHIPTGRVVGQGVGSCSTMESKYRWRTGQVTPTGRPVPKEYWDLRKENPKDAQDIIGGRGFNVRKVDGNWQIVEQGERVENQDIGDTWNTVIKMAKKRAFVDSMLTATAASDIFTQDEELEEAAGAPGEQVSEQPPAPPLQKQPNGQQGENQQSIDKGAWHPTEKQVKRMFAIKSSGGWGDTAFTNLLSRNGIGKPDDIASKTQYDMICGVLEKGSPKAETQESQPKEGPGLTRTEFCGKIDTFSRKHIEHVREVMKSHNFDPQAIPSTPELRTQVIQEIEEAIFAAAEAAGI